MKKFLYQFFAIALALAFVGCGNDDLLDKNTGTDDPNPEDTVYMNVMVKLPTGPGTRSTTEDEGGSSDGTEIGLDRENSVYSILLVLADTQNKLIGCAEKSVGTINKNGSTISTVQSISKSVIAAYYEEKGNNGALDPTTTQNINVFVFCNPTDALRRIFEGVSAGDETWHEQICSISENPDGTSNNAAIWGGSNYQSGFLMSSSEIATKKLPLKFSDWDDFTTEDHPFLLTGKNSNIGGNSDATVENDKNGNAIKVERSVARFDFKDGSGNNNTYDVVKNQDGELVMQIQLQKMALVNMSKNFYYLRRVSADGTDTDADLCGTETSGNYVVDTDAAGKNDRSIIENGTYKDHFNFCLGNPENDWAIDGSARLQWYTSQISEVLAGTDDHENWTGHGDYKIWRYVTENTIPGVASNQATGISTGIVFKGKMIAPAGATGTLADALNSEEEVSKDNPILYAYGSEIFVRWTEVRAMAISQGVTSPMYKAVFGTPQNVTPAAQLTDGSGAIYSDDPASADFKWNAWYNQNKESETSKKTFKAAATAAGFTLYERSMDDDTGKGYYCYYFYWNRHNDNGNGGVMGRMEFGVVRNNVYKLAVNSIHKLGHPRVSENDPDPVDPDDPDEEGDVYLSVSVEVLPWVVRINDIDF